MFEGVPGGEHEHGQSGVLLSQPAQHLEPVHVGQHPVQHDGMRGAAARDPQRTVSVRREKRLPAGSGHGHGQQLGQLRLVVDDQHTYGAFGGHCLGGVSRARHGAEHS